MAALRLRPGPGVRIASRCHPVYELRRNPPELVSDFGLTLSCQDRKGSSGAVGSSMAAQDRAYDMTVRLVDLAVRQRVLILASKADHCLNDLLYPLAHRTVADGACGGRLELH